METIAQTNLQLYNQLIETGRDSVELEVIRRTYDFATTIYPGYYQADGKPFVAHSVGVASILAHLDMPAEFIATGLLHNIYGNGDFGDGLQNVPSSSRRNLVRNSVGNQIEALVFRFRSFRILPESIERLANGIDAFNRTDRNLLLVDLADYLEKYVDLGILYYGDNRWITDVVARNGDQLIDIARRLNQPKLSTMLAEAFERARGVVVPGVLCMPKERRFLQLVVPRSCMVRPTVIATRSIRAFKKKLHRTIRLVVHARRLRSYLCLIGSDKDP